MDDMLTRVRALYEDYLKTAEDLEKNRKIGEGLLGFGRKPADNPCHLRFAADLETMLREFAAEGPDSDGICPVLAYIYHAQLDNRTYHSIYWMLAAVHGATEPLIPLLRREDAAGLLETYESEVPRRERLPVQKKICRALKERAH